MCTVYAHSSAELSAKRPEEVWQERRSNRVLQESVCTVYAHSSAERPEEVRQERRSTIGSLCESSVHERLKTYVCILDYSPCALLIWPHG